ncbi:MAG: AAA family ATPase [Deltaproteobacteria bacterium]|nr:AAA family ATPase [Deltaproteobacteria bacterium]
MPSYRRYIYSAIDTALSQRLIGILGSRGVGKTTLMLQIIKERFGISDKALYISVDHPYFEANPLYEFAEYFSKYGGELLCIDEVHKYPDWSSHIKAIYDDIPNLKIIFSGSSILQMSKQKGDLSRRAIVYQLGGLSFREYLNIAHGFTFKAYSLEEILKDHISIASKIIEDIKILPLFKEYLDIGYYPFVLEGKEFYRQKLTEILNHTLETDLPFTAAIAIRQISKLKKLLYILAKSVPFIPNITELARSTDISRPTIYDYLEKLKDAKVLLLLQKVGRGYENISKPDKLYLENTNLMGALSLTPDKGTMRETFFANQIINAYADNRFSANELIAIPKNGDFLIKGRWTFEVGGKNKKEKQISGIPDSYILADEIVIGYDKRIPLWLMGFLY